jgi:AcrR family transcriptional regulator
MSRKDSNLKQRIIDRAQELFNEHGIIAIGMRELARELALSPGNLTYHFARKEDLLLAIAARLAVTNADTLQQLAQLTTFTQFFDAYRQLLRNQYQFRCFPLQLVYVLDTYPTLAARYGENQLRRTSSFEAILRRLQAAGRLDANMDEALLGQLVGYCTLIGRFWLSEYWISYRDQPLDQVIQRYVGLLALAVLPYTTEVGRREVEPYLTAQPATLSTTPLP